MTGPKSDSLLSVRQSLAQIYPSPSLYKATHRKGKKGGGQKKEKIGITKFKKMNT